jgi:ketosteroid isomerase-like protein
MMNPTEVFDRATRCLLAGDASGYADAFAPNGIVEWPFAAEGWPKRLQGREAIRAHVTGIFARFQTAGRKLVGVRDVINHSIGTRELAVEFSMEATTPTGTTLLPYVQFLKVTDDGHIALLRDYFRPMTDAAPPAAPKSGATAGSGR